MPKKILKNIIFTKSKLIGHYRYKDEFQIYPLNIEKAPKSNIVNHIPCCFEFHYNEEDVKYFNPIGLEHFDKMLSETATQVNKRNRILNLLSVISNYRFHLKGRADVIWTVPMPEEMTKENRESIQNISSKPGFESYVYPSIKEDLQIEKFTEICSANVLRLKHLKYYLYDPVDGKNKQIKFPDTIDQILDKYFSLDKKSTLIVDSAAFQLCNALDLNPQMKSLSFFSAVSAIETMINIEYKGEKIEFACQECKTIKSSTRVCRKCGKPKWGVAEKFREFLGKYVSATEESRKTFNKIYSIRSKIAHTEYLIFNENILDWNFTDKSKSLYMKHMEAIQIGRISIVNWLLKN